MLAAAHARAGMVATASPRLRPGFVAQSIRALFDAIYGSRVSLAKFRAQELVARAPYQAWERLGYAGITRRYPRPAQACAAIVAMARSQQDNEQRHLFWIEELCERRGEREDRLRGRLVQWLARLFTFLAWAAHAIRPRWSYLLNAQLEDIAEHDYLRYVAEHPELELEPATSTSFASVADQLRAIALDERLHKEESLARAASVESARDAMDARRARPHRHASCVARRRDGHERA